MGLGIGIGISPVLSNTIGSGNPPINTVTPVIIGDIGLGGELITTNGTWVGDPVIAYSYQWNRNGIAILGETNSTYTITISDSNKNITCTVTATNDTGSANATSNTISIPVFSAPSNTVAPVISGTTSLGSTLTTTTGTWTGTPAITYAYQWKRGINNIIGATNSTYVLVVADSGASITCVVTATNAIGSSNATSNTLTADTYTAPSNTVAPAITGTAQEGQTVTCSTGTWTGTPTITYAYQWKRNGSNIGSATNSTYTLVTADVSQSITCQVTATNAVGSANATSNTITPIAAIDPDAQAFITAASITNPTQQSAINTLVTDLKGYNIWTKFKAIYPIVGGTAASHKFNLKDPRDLDAAFRLTFATGWTHSSTGMTPNGSSAFADTKLNLATQTSLFNVHYSMYARTSLDGGIDMGVANSNIGYKDEGWMASRNNNFAKGGFYDNDAGVYGGGINVANTDGKGFYVSCALSANNIFFRKNAVSLGTASGANSGPANTTIYLGAVHLENNNTAIVYSAREYAFFTIGDGLTTTQSDNLYTAVNAYQVALSRNI